MFFQNQIRRKTLFNQVIESLSLKKLIVATPDFNPIKILSELRIGITHPTVSLNDLLINLFLVLFKSFHKYKIFIIF